MTQDERDMRAIGSETEECENCHGTGYGNNNKQCANCNGNGVVETWNEEIV